MANVMHHHIDFQPRPVSHAPSPFGFGFGLGSNSSTSSPVASSSWGVASTPGHTNVAAFQQLASSINQSAMRPAKRRYEFDDDDNSQSQGGARDESMDRSPTPPERPKRAAPKRARMVPSAGVSDKENSSSTGSKTPSGSPDEVDIGVLLGSPLTTLYLVGIDANRLPATLPAQSLLPLFLKLLKTHPSLKSEVLSHIPKPTLEFALQAIEQALKKLREAYPYSNTTSNAVSFGFGSTIQQPPPSNQGGMRDSYIISRIQPHILELVSCINSYLPYFTANSTSNLQPTQGSQLTQTIQSIHKDNSHPAETFAFLSRVMSQILELPPLAISSMAPLVLPRLSEEWQTWVDGIDAVVNKQGGMFGSEAVRGWERVLDHLADTRAVEVSAVMRPIRDKWVVKVGWLVGRQAPNAMDH